MKAFTQHCGIAAPLDRANVDTDAIIPKQYLKSVRRSGFGVNAFDDWRYLDPGEPGSDHAARRPNPDFVLNQAPFDEATVLLARDNFGCGSSREHAVWALEDFGFRAVIAPSFADIFFNNCFKNGVLPVVLPSQVVDHLFVLAREAPASRTCVDLERCLVIDARGDEHEFSVDADRRRRLLEGLDDIALTLELADRIRAYEQRARRESPWRFAQ
ncbi:MAG: 3-isopropylmalate dehydratase small subunit [Thioalkalivibrionaceae bacterium]